MNDANSISMQSMITVNSKQLNDFQVSHKSRLTMLLNHCCGCEQHHQHLSTYSLLRNYHQH